MITSVRAWPGVITVGVNATRPGAGRGGTARRELVLRSVTGKHIRTYPAAESGGAVLAGLRRTVIVEPTAVVSYANSTGEAAWRDPTGSAAQAWRVVGHTLYMTVSASGQLGTEPVTAIRQIDLRTGEEQLIRPPGGSFDGMLTGVLGGVLVFSSGSGLSMYSVSNGRRTGQRPGAVAVGGDPAQHVLYADIAGVLTGIDPVTGRDITHIAAGVPPGVYSVREGAAFGLDPGAQGAAWGYSMAEGRVIWTAKALPWPHYFAEPSGLGGSVDPGSGIVLLVTCQATGNAVRGTVADGGGWSCLRPRLVAIGPWDARS